MQRQNQSFSVNFIHFRSQKFVFKFVQGAQKLGYKHFVQTKKPPCVPIAQRPERWLNMENAEKELMFSLSKSYDLYNYMLQLIVAITQEARKRYDVDVARAKREGEQEPSPRFAFNKFALQLEENKMLLEWIDVKHSNWDEDIEMVRKVYTAITSSDLYADYISGAIDEELADLDEYSRDREVWRRIYKQFIQNNEELDAFLEEKSLYWNDDKDIIDTFVLKTIKRFDPEAKAKQELLPEYKDAEDREFARKLFRATILNCDTYQRYMSEALRNWDFSRLAYMDVIIMQIAIAEVMNFPGIPATVTINEYVELAKAYSTPRSGGYVNGMLDSICRELISRNLIQKEMPERKQHQHAQHGEHAGKQRPDNQHPAGHRPRIHRAPGKGE